MRGGKGKRHGDGDFFFGGGGEEAYVNSIVRGIVSVADMLMFIREFYQETLGKQSWKSRIVHGPSTEPRYHVWIWVT